MISRHCFVCDSDTCRQQQEVTAQNHHLSPPFLEPVNHTRQDLDDIGHGISTNQDSRIQFLNQLNTRQLHLVTDLRQASRCGITIDSRLFKSDIGICHRLCQLVHHFGILQDDSCRIVPFFTEHLLNVGCSHILSLEVLQSFRQAHHLRVGIISSSLKNQEELFQSSTRHFVSNAFVC